METKHVCCSGRKIGSVHIFLFGSQERHFILWCEHHHFDQIKVAAGLMLETAIAETFAATTPQPTQERLFTNGATESNN